MPTRLRKADRIAGHVSDVSEQVTGANPLTGREPGTKRDVEDLRRAIKIPLE